MYNSDFVFEKKKYEGSDITPEVIAAINSRVTISTPYLMVYREIEVCSSETIELMFKRTNELIKKMDKFGLLIDVSVTEVPDAHTRRTINSEFKHICESVEHVAFITGKKLFFNTLLKFIMFQTNLDSYSVHENEEEAILKIKEIVGV